MGDGKFAQVVLLTPLVPDGLRKCGQSEMPHVHFNLKLSDLSVDCSKANTFAAGICVRKWVVPSHNGGSMVLMVRMKSD